MFTGIIETVGKLSRHEARGGDVRLRIDTGGLDMSDVSLGDSIAVNGVCLTVIDFSDRQFSADVSNETLAHTTLGQLRLEAPLNLEKAMQLSTRLGGHMVSGHVDGVGKVQSRRDDARSVRFTIEVPMGLAKYIAAKGSVCIDGTSLTVNQTGDACFDINIVPHTMQKTIISEYKEGSLVNIEVDVVARYLERLLLSDSGKDKSELSSSLTAASLVDAGFTTFTN
ncbi:MAG: riboflavin synthase [Gammaproteobacteria bacterium]|nr:riboflavin synthase [Gammaproteobacteria bacterium]PCH62125.1 MAG: riboflavin synthase [Gammaproteobacteria bacterium]PCH62659.1 MAG: riboflavin synthase [Gammaproteobacteria bacterium]